MLFNNRRQSKDSALRARLLELVGSGVVWMNPYSAGQFAEVSDAICVDDDFLAKANNGEYCFVENTDISSCADAVEQLIVFRWNRCYPADMKFPLELFSNRWQLVSRADFAGNSHERITQEVYAL